VGKLIRDTNIPILDSLRAFAALSVCLYHFVCTTTGYITTEWVLTIFSVGKYGVQLFFVISGFVIPWAMFNAGFTFPYFFKFLLKRLARLEPPYVFSIVIALTILFLREKLLGSQNDHLEISFKQVILHFGYLIPFFEGYKWLNQVYWTLAIEFQYYFFIAFLFIPLIRARMLYRIIIYVAIIALSFIGNNNFLPYWLPVFLLGVTLFLYKSKLIIHKEYYIISALILGFCFYKYPTISVLYTIIPIVFILFFSGLKIKGLNFLGKMSYSIYLIHPLIGASFINILSHSVNSFIGKVFVMLGGILITLISSYLMYLIVEKPSRKLSSSIKYKKINKEIN
jgi:peptidoglycan/LPS O-acetylase OafA/YrhL